MLTVHFLLLGVYFFKKIRIFGSFTWSSFCDGNVDMRKTGDSFALFFYADFTLRFGRLKNIHNQIIVSMVQKSCTS